VTEFATQTTTEGAAHLILDGAMTIYNAADIKSRLLDALGAAPTLELDLSHVTEVDTAGFQLLVMIKRESQRTDRTLRIVAHSPAVQEVIDFFNMGAFFGDPLIITAHQE
jgi:anti-sigma B factor antagonist